VKNYKPAMTLTRIPLMPMMTRTDVGMRQRLSHCWNSWREVPCTGTCNRHRADRVTFVRRGIRVDGIDFLICDVAKLRTKPGADKIAITMGNFADVAVPMPIA